MPPRLSRYILLVASWSAALAPFARPAVAGPGVCSELAYSFQPDCYQPNGGGVCGQTLAHLDFGPQIAVWIETADHTLVETLMVTSLTATRGIGNRPGIWNFRSSPKFPYGKRWMSLPIWAYAQGQLWNTVFFQDDQEMAMGFHEAVSSPEPYFCRPLGVSDLGTPIDVVTCPSQYPKGFNSSKGKLESTTKSYYPPRSDLTMFTNNDCDIEGDTLPTCNVSAETYQMINNGVDAVSAATPPYGQPYTRTWYIPPNLAPGSYALVVEVNKEYDTNASWYTPAFEDPALPSYGIDGNFGQPSVLYRVPVQLGGSTPTAVAVSEIAGYSDSPPDGVLDGKVLPRDGTISTNVPGSGELRLLSYDGPGGVGRVHVQIERCGTEMSCPDGGAGCADGSSPPPDAAVTDASVPDAPERAETPLRGPCQPEPTPPGAVMSLAATSTDATTASIAFLNAASAGGPVDHYDIRYRQGGTLTEMEFTDAVPAPFVVPGAPGQPATVVVPDLIPATDYVLGVRAVDFCGQVSPLATVAFKTAVVKYTQLTGCFVATAAYGSVLEPEVASLRRARDRLRAGSALFAVATDLYYQSGPAAAAVVQRSPFARGLARRVIGPFAGLAEALNAFDDALARNGTTSRR